MNQQWTPWQYVWWYCQAVVAGFFRWVWGKVFGRRAVATEAHEKHYDAATVRRDRIAHLLWKWYGHTSPAEPPSRAPWLAAKSIWQERAALLIAEMERAA